MLVNIGYEDDETEEEAEAFADDVVQLLEEISVVTIEADPAEVQEFSEAEDNNVRFIERARRGEAHQQEPAWGVDRVTAADAHDEAITGEGASIAILDSGIDPTHEDLEDNIGEGFAPVECVGNCEEPWDDDHGHGTHVAGIAGAIDQDFGVLGVAPDVTLHSVKVLNQFNRGWDFHVAAGLVWAANEGIDIANMSLGNFGPTLTLSDGVEYAHEEGMLVVSSAGNDGPGDDTVNFPGAFEDSMAIGSTTEFDSISFFSSRGPEVDMVAPGSSVRSTLPGNDYGFLSGTSMAAPHVAGAAALLLSQDRRKKKDKKKNKKKEKEKEKELEDYRKGADGKEKDDCYCEDEDYDYNDYDEIEFDNEELRERLVETAEDLDFDEVEQGSGLLDVPAALDL